MFSCRQGWGLVARRGPMKGAVLKHPRHALDLAASVGAGAVQRHRASVGTRQRPAELRAGPSPACGYLLGWWVFVARW